MNILAEVGFIRRIMANPCDVILSNWDIFMEIVDELCTSHEDAFSEVDADTLPVFLEFAQWLVDVGRAAGVDMEGTAVVFRSTPNAM